jgi:integrase
MPRTPSYLCDHKSGGYKYQKWIPRELQDAWKPKKRMFIRYIPRMPRREAEAKAREFAVQDDAEIAALRAVGPSFLEWMGRSGKTWREIMNDPAYRFQTHEEPDGTIVTRSPDLMSQTQKSVAIVVHGLVNKSKTSWDALYADWFKIRAPKQTRKHAATIQLAKQFFGEVDCRNISQAEVGRFRDDLIIKEELSRGVVERHLKNLSSMYNASSNEPTSAFALVTNPASGVKTHGKPMPQKEASPFSIQQSHTILETAERIGFGRDRHVETIWALRILTWTGMRPNEAFQLQKNDIMEKDGVRFFRIQEIDCVTGEKHWQKSVKTEDARDFPIPDALMDFVDYIKPLEAGEFIFGKFPYDKNNGRASYLTRRFGAFLKNKCEIIDEPPLKFVLYSTRHAYVSAMRVASVPEDIRALLLGHGKSIARRYGAHSLPQLRDYVNSVKPLG